MGLHTQTHQELFLPIRPDYADFDVPVQLSFRWADILQQLRVMPYQQVALFAFRSIQKADVDQHILHMLDEGALLAAKEAPGFIHYQSSEGLSYCLWQTHADARAAISAPAHLQAAEYAPQAYERYELQSWLVARTAIPGNVEFVPVEL